jgi:energy-coupling factor transport system ATP-binding protein
MPIVIDKLNFTYMPGSSQEYRALTDISLTIEDGEFFGIIGHTGSGKSTFIQHLNGLILPTSGSVSVDGFRMEDKKQRAKGRRLVGMVFQYPEYQLFEETVEKDIAYGPGNRGLSESEISDRVREAMELVGLPYETFREKSPFELSGGEKRRAALAGIIAMRPKYLVLDEPMAGLDPRGRKNILNTIRLLRERTKCGIIMVSHSMDDIAGEAERIAVLDSGKLRQVGTPKEIFSDSESLLEMGLDLPQVSRLALELRKGGVTVPEGLFRLDEMKEFLLRGIRRV